MQSRDGRSARETYRFVHASGLHLDSPVRDVGGAPEALRAALRDASLRTWDAVVESAIAREAAFVVLAGGLFDGERATLRACVALGAGVQRLRAHAIDVFIARTAEDMEAAPRLPLLAEGATLFDHDRMSTAYAMRDGACLATLHVAAGADAEARRLQSALRPSGLGVEIGVLPQRPAANDARGLAELLAKTGLAYWAVGGASQYAVLQEEPPIVCAGTTQGRGLEAAERGPKGCVLVEVDDGRVGSTELIPLDHVRFASLEVDVSACADAAAMRRLLVDAADRVRDGAGERLHVVEAVLCGACAARDAGDRLALERELLADLRRAGTPERTRLWWARVRDRTSRSNRRTGAAPGDLRRIVIDRSEALDAPLPRGRFLARTFAPLLRRWDAESDLDTQRELVRDAAALALDVVEAEGPR